MRRTVRCWLATLATLGAMTVLGVPAVLAQPPTSPPAQGQVQPPQQTVPGQTVPGQTVPGQTVPGQTVPGAPQPGQVGPPDYLIVEMALLAELDAWPEPLPATVDQVWETVDLESVVDLDDEDAPYDLLDQVDAAGASVLAGMRGQGRTPSAEVDAALGGLSQADWDALEAGEPISVQAQTYVDALIDLLSTQGAAPTGPRAMPQQSLDNLLANMSVAAVLGQLDPSSTTVPPGGVSTTAAPTTVAPSTTAAASPAASAASEDDSSSIVVLVALIGVLALVVVALLVTLVARRRDDEVSEKAQRVEQADGLLDIASRLTRARDLVEVERLAVTEAVRITGGDGGGFVAVVPDGLSVTHQTADALLVPERIGEGMVSRVVDTGQALATVSQTEPAVSRLPVSLAAAPVISRGAVQGVLVVLRHGEGAFAEADVTALTKLAPVVAAALETFDRLEAAETDALVDPLTRLGNRRSLDRALAGDTSAPTPRPISVLMVDVDHFKHFNDTNGHAAGDEALRAVAAAITSVLREGDAAFRFGGEEFCVVLPGAGEAQAAEVGERVRAAVEALEVPGGERQPGGRVTVSIGAAAAVDAQGQAVQGDADRALYAAKAEGRNRVVTASSLTDA